MVPPRRRRIVAFSVASSIVIGALLAVSAPAAANASTSSSISYIISKLNSFRVSHSDPALKRNTFIDMNAEENAKQYAAFGASSLESFTPPTPLPLDSGMTPSPPASTADFICALSGSNATARLASCLISANAALVEGSYNYVGVGFATRGSGSYAYVVLANYTNPPLKRITPGKATIPTSVRVGTNISVAVDGFAPSGITYSYVWKTNGSPFGSNSKQASLQSGNFGQLITVIVTAHKAGYADSIVPSNSSKPVLLGIPLAPKVLTITGHRNVGQTLAAPGPNTDGWGPYFVNTYSYQWLSNGHPITGATSDSYLVAPTDYGKRIDLRMSLTGPDYGVSTRQTHTHTLTGHPLLAVLGTPSITGGDAAWGASRTPSFHIFIEGVTYTVKWLLNGHVVSTHFTYTPPVSAAFRHLAIEVTGHLAGYAATSVTSPTVTVLDKSFASSASAIISGGSGPGGAAEYGDKLKVTLTHASTPGATTYTYQWYLDTTPIAGAVHSTMTLKAGIPALSIGVSVTAHRTGYTPDPFSTGIPYN